MHATEPNDPRRSRPYDSLAAFYEDAFGQHVTEKYALGSWGATLMTCVQTRGDWSDPPVPELVIGHLRSDPLEMTSDFGGGLARRTMVANSFVVIPPRFATTFLMDAPHVAQFVGIPYQTLVDQLDGSSEHALPEDGDLGVLHSRVWTDRIVTGSVKAILAEFRSGNPHGTLGADGLLLQLIARILSLRNRATVRRERSGLAPWQVRRVMSRIDDDLAHEVSLRDLAELVGLSPFHLCRAFARSTGLPPHKWRLKRRIERAQTLLTGTRKSVTEIALDLGYATPQHFSSSFKKEVGVNPTVFRASGPSLLAEGSETSVTAPSP